MIKTLNQIQHITLLANVTHWIPNSYRLERESVFYKWIPHLERQRRLPVAFRTLHLPGRLSLKSGYRECAPR